MAATKRLRKELEEIKKGDLCKLVKVSVDESNILNWTGVIIPNEAPYNKGAFKVDIQFPAEYPFKPPKITFKTKIYHPNVDEKGQVCLDIINTENWKPATKCDQVMNALIALINEPKLEQPLRADVAELYLKNKKEFMKVAEEHTKKNAEPRP